jgi:hypothetical protein
MKLSKKGIDLDELRMLAAQGVRSTLWKVLNSSHLLFLPFLIFFSDCHF